MFKHKVLSVFRKVMPPISQTESEALESGTVGWDAELMSGRPDWRNLFALPKPVLTAEEQAFVDGPVEELCRLMDDWAIMNGPEKDLPPAAWDYMRNEGFFGLVIPKAFGGKGFSAHAHSEVIMKLATRSIVGAVTVMVPNSLGPGELLAHYGTQEQKDYYLPRLARGEEIPCFALTEPQAGSDAGGIQSYGVAFRDENGQVMIRLNWEKRYITLAPVATILGLAFQLEDPDNLLGKGVAPGITCALIPTDTPRVEIGRRHSPMNIHFMNGPTWGRDVVIPADWIIGGADKAGQGWRMLMECLSIGRSISLPSNSVAAAKVSVRTTGAYSAIRTQFGLPVGKFEGVEEKLARIAGMTYVMDAARVATAQMVDRGERPAIPSAIIKYHLTERMRIAVNDAMDVQSGKAVIQGPNNLLGYAYQGIPIGITVEGANVMTRNLIVFGQGLVRTHPFLLKEIRAAAIEDKDRAADELFALIKTHAVSVFKSFGRSLWYGVTGRGGSVPDHVDGNTSVYYRRVNRMSAALYFVSNITLAVVGGGLKKKERLSARLGDVLSQIYLASCALRFYEVRGAVKAELPLLRWAVETALTEAEEALIAALKNYPVKLVGCLLSVLVFPLGRRYSRPSDRLEHDVARSIMKSGEVRDRLTHGMFLPSAGSDHPIARLEEALVLTEKSEGLENFLKQAEKSGRLKGRTHEDLIAEGERLGDLSAEDVALLRRANDLRLSIIHVDHFAPERD